VLQEQDVREFPRFRSVRPAAASGILLPETDLQPSSNSLSCRIRRHERHEFPVRAEFAKSIKKSQGQTVNAFQICVPEPVFSRDQLYVALWKDEVVQNGKQGLFTGLERPY
jgi:hypothetical protein